jgi:hypothetical protein
MNGSLSVWIRPRSYWDVVGKHLPLALLSGMALLVAGLVPLDLLPIGACTFLDLTGYPCPFCGFSRSFWAMARWDWAYAFHEAPLGCLFYVTVVLTFGVNALGLLLVRQIRLSRLLWPQGINARWAFIIVSILLLLNWCYRLALGLK